MIVTEKMLKEARTEKGGFSQAQVDLAIRLFGKPWKKNMLGKFIPECDWEKFCSLSRRTKAASLRESKKKKSLRQSQRAKGIYTDPKKFYSSDEWRRLRYRVIVKYGSKCHACGRSPKEHGVVIHVDHIKPRSKFPQLELCFENLQILCEDCNLGKLNKDQTDWRPSTTLLTDEEMAEIEMAQAASEYI